jgi:hypothetical protein
MAYVAELHRLQELGLDLFDAAGSKLPHGDRMDRVTAVVRQIQESMNAAQVAFDAELPFLLLGFEDGF